MATHFQLSLFSDQTSILYLIHELLSNEGQIPGKQELNQTYYLGPTPLLHSTFFTLTLINPRAINEIYHWHQLERGGKRARKDKGKGRMEAKSQTAGGISHGSQLFELTKPSRVSKTKIPNINKERAVS